MSCDMSFLLYIEGFFSEVSVNNFFLNFSLRKMNYNELSEIPYFGETTSNITLLSL